MEIEYKDATADDIPVLISIEQSVAGNKSYSPMLEEDEWRDALKDGKVFLLERDGEVVGNASYEPREDDDFYISGLAIMPQYQGLGIGREVLKKMMEDMKDAKRIELVTHPDNAAALKLYKEAGFIVESRKENYYGDGEPRLLLSRTKGFEDDADFIAWAEQTLNTKVIAQRQLLGDANVVYKLQSSLGEYFLKIGRKLQKERERLDWLQGRQPAPRVLGMTHSGDRDALLLSAIKGVTLKDVAAEWGAEKVIDVLIEALHRLHATDIHDCPFGTRKEGNVLVHGDACLPNFVVNGDVFSGYIDLEDLRMDDKEVDFAAGIYSLQYNLGKGFGMSFLKKYGVQNPTEEMVERLYLRYEKMKEDWAMK